MSADGQNMKIPVIAGADLRAAQYKVIAVAGTIAASNGASIGVLYNKPNTNESATVAYLGHMKAYCGGAIAANGRMKVTTSGYLVAVASGDGSVGKALAAANSGSLVEFVGDFSNADTTY